MQWGTIFVIVMVFFLLVNLTDIVDAFKLFKGEDHADPVVDERLHELYRTGACVNLIDGYKSLRSVDTPTPTCVQLYARENCMGPNVKIPSGIFRYNNLKELNFDDRAVSVSKCRSIVQLYNRAHYQGRKIRFWVDDYGDCVTLNGTERVVNSVDIYGGCLVLYHDDSCENTLSRVIDKISDTSWVGLVGSIGPCSHRYRNDINSSRIQLHQSSINPNELMLGQFVRSENAVVIKTRGVPRDHYCELARRCTNNRLFDCDHAMKAALTCYCERSQRIVFCYIWQPPYWIRASSIYTAVEDYQNRRKPIVGEIHGTGIYIGTDSYETPYVNTQELKRRCEIGKSLAVIRGLWSGGFMDMSCETTSCFPDEPPSGSVGCSFGSFVRPRKLSAIEEDEDFEAFSYF